MKISFRFKLRLPSKKKKRREESWKSKERRMHLIILRRPKKKRDSDKSRPSSNNSLIVRLLSSWRSEIKKKKSWTSKSLKLKTKQLNFSKKRKEEESRWPKQLKEVERTRSLSFIKRNRTSMPRKKNLLSSGKWEMKSWPSLSNRRKRKKDREELSWPTIWRSRPMRRISRHKKTSLTSSILLLEISRFRINKKRISTHMPKSASRSGLAKAKTWNHSSWNWRITKRELFEISKKYSDI